MCSRRSEAVFFFQAEDGIRDDLVTGVQTCALPIYLLHQTRCGRLRPTGRAVRTNLRGLFSVVGSLARQGAHKNEPRSTLKNYLNEKRSEERRVGKECRSQREAARGVKSDDQVSNRL